MSRATTRRAYIFRISIVVILFFGCLALIVSAIRNLFNDKPLPVERVIALADVRLPELMLNEYDNTMIKTENSLKKYYKDGVLNSKVGIDVSFAQGEIDWVKVKNAGIDFAIIRVGYRGYESGDIFLDEYYLKNMERAAIAGIETGVYFFSQAVCEKEAIEEAKFIIEHLQGHNITYPVVFDWETIIGNEARTDSVSGTTLNACATAFCDEIESAGYTPFIYASLNLLREQFDKYDIAKVSGDRLWLAEYKRYPEFPYKFKMWQYTDSGIVDGIDCEVDMNLYFGK